MSALRIVADQIRLVIVDGDTRSEIVCFTGVRREYFYTESVGGRWRGKTYFRIPCPVTMHFWPRVHATLAALRDEIRIDAQALRLIGAAEFVRIDAVVSGAL